ncbi:uncharacterized protein LOC143357015 [Halictus rubicundus]|uniref:uncharacterized protein LOC143357015 n=1 Tax=Halictus rubicundus TaxID=77578 RepID=UPI004036A123
MCENFVINAQDLREHLSHVGKKVQLATETILGTFNAVDCNFQRNLVLPDNRINKTSKTFKRETTMEGMDVDQLNSNEICIDIDSSDSDVDNNYYAEEWELSSVKSPESAPLHASIEFCDNTTISDRTTPCAVVDIEIFEENNNDPNNNLDSVQRYHEQENEISVLSNEIQRAEVAECESDPLPGCSKDFNEKESQYYDNKLQEEALKIHSLLPQFKYRQIFAALRKNHFAENRVLLALWDLLPSKRPMALRQFVHKKTIRDCKSDPSEFSTGDHTDTSFENNEVILIENKNRNNGAIAMQDITVFQVQDEDEDIVLLNDISNFKNTGAIPKKKDNIISIQSNTVPRIQNGILHPAKLNLNTISDVKERYTKKCEGNECKKKRIPIGKNAFERNSTSNCKQGKLNRYMDYLEYVKNIKKQKNAVDFRHVNFPVRNSIRQFFLHSKFKHSNMNISQFIKKNNKLKVLNTADTNRNKNKQSKDKKQVCGLFRYDTEDLQYSSDNTSISGSPENLELFFGNEPTVATCKNSNTVSSCNTSNHLPMDTVDAPSDNHTNNIERPLTKISTESSATSSVQFHVIHDEKSDETSINTPYNSPNNLNIPNSSSPIEQVSGDEKRKESTQEKENALFQCVEPIYNNLLPMFPSIDQDYIKNLCFSYLEKDGDIVNMLEDLVDYLLEHRRECPSRKDYKRVCKEQTPIMNQQVVALLSIFPEADEAYLRKAVQLMKGNQNAITDFIETQCNNPTYITKKENLRRMKISNYQKQYFSNFNAEMFLELFPDPFQHFENVNRQCKYNSEAIKFLQSRYSDLTETILKTRYKEQKYNLSLTAQVLDINRLPNTVKLNTIYDIPLLQECAFILHKGQIRDCMNRIKDKENKEFEKLKKNNELWICENCYDNECMPSKCFTCNDGHIFCKNCINVAVKVELGKGNVHIKCFSLNCNEIFSCSTLQKALPPTQFSVLLSKKQETEVMAAELEGLVSCPFCSFASIPPPDDKVFRCLDPECMKESCRFCKTLNHVPLKCEDVTKKSKARLLLEEKMTEALVRKCQMCRKPYFKNDGCNKITCTCGLMMCYICEQVIQGANHFNDISGCPYYSDNTVLNRDTVNAVANETLKYIAEKGIQIEAYPLVSQSVQATHTVTPEVSKRVDKVAKFDM